MIEDARMLSPRFPRASRYHPDWILASTSGGACSLWLTEWLVEALDLQAGMRVLDLGCGRGASSIFLHRELGVQVWAADLWFAPSERLQRIRAAGVEDGVFPLHADARALPFAAEFFDAVVSIDAFPYFGTDDLYLESLARVVKPGGVIGIAGAGLTHEIEGHVPEHLRAFMEPNLEPSLACLHSSAWWREHWERTGIVDVETADTLDDGWQHWLAWQRLAAPDNHTEIAALEADRGRTLGYTRVVARRRAGVQLAEPISSLPVTYRSTALLR